MNDSKAELIHCLMAEADAGVVCKVSVIDALDFRRDQYGLTWAEFGAILGISASQMSYFKTGRRRLPLNAMKRAYAIGVPADVLLQRDVKKGKK